MPDPRIYRTEALVLKAFDYGEADKILTLYTPGRGKLRAIAKGVRRTKSRKAGHLDLFTRSTLLLARGRQFDVITQAESIDHFGAMRDDLWRSSFAHYVAELIDGFTAEDLPSYPLYSLAVVTFGRLTDAADLDLVTRAFEMQLLGVTGYRPQLHRCLQCSELIEPGQNRFSVSMGGVLCPSCGMLDQTAHQITVPALKLLRNLQNNERATLSLSALDPDVHREVEARLREYIVYRLERAPRSAGFLDRLRTERARA